VAVFLIRLRLRARRESAEEAAAPVNVREDAAELIRQLEQAGAAIDKKLESHLGELRGLLARVSAASADLDARMRLIEEPDGVYRGSGDTRPDDDAGRAAGRSSPRQTEVLRLGQQGIEPIEIARRTGMTVGEVELVLHLHAGRAEA
jgi:DNA-binding NarL/FixJ family response regulator